jgi:hypothetical protein
MQNTSIASQSPVLIVDENQTIRTSDPGNFNVKWPHTSTWMPSTAQIFKVLVLQPLLALTPSLSHACCLLLGADECLGCRVDLGFVRVRAPKDDEVCRIGAVIPSGLGLSLALCMASI